MNDYDVKNLVKVKIKDLLFNDWNPKDDEMGFEKVKKSVEVNGMMTAVIVREVNGGLEVVDGNQRVRAAKELGLDEIYVYNLGKISDEQAKQLVLYLQLQVPFSDSMLANIAVELDEAGITLPYDEKTMDGFRNLASFDFDSAYADEIPLPEEDKGYRDDSMKFYKLEMDEEDIDIIMGRIEIVKDEENLNEGKAFRLLIETGAGMVEKSEEI